MVIWQQNNFGNNGVFSIEPAEINRCKNILIHLKTFASIVLSASWFSRLLFPPAPWLFFLLCFFFRVFFPCWNDSAVDYQTQIALIAGTNWKESIPGAECICLPVQKWASVPYLTSSGKGAKKPLCRRPLNSALNHTLGRFLSDEATEQADDVRKKHCTYAPPPRSTRETTGEIIHEDGWKFSRAIDALLRLAGTRSEGLWNTCRGGSGERTTPSSMLPPPLCTIAHCAEFCGLALIEEQHLAYWACCWHPLEASWFFTQWDVWMHTRGGYCLLKVVWTADLKGSTLRSCIYAFYMSLLYSRLCAWVCIKDPKAYQHSPQSLVALRFGFLFQMWRARPWR